jgi:hypothetical protein
MLIAASIFFMLIAASIFFMLMLGEIFIRISKIEKTQYQIVKDLCSTLHSTLLSGDDVRVDKDCVARYYREVGKP